MRNASWVIDVGTPTNASFMSHPVMIVFVFLLGSCVGSFLNVVVWRLPRGESLSDPPSHCPKCDRRLNWYDNIPIIGWIKLGGRCRFCKAPISARYPIIEAVTAALFVFYYVMFFMKNVGPCVRPSLGQEMSPMSRPLDLTRDWPIFSLYLYLLSALLAASLIDAELFIIPTSIIWSWKGGVLWVALLVHALADGPGVPGALTVGPLGGAVAAGGAVGLLVSILLLRIGKLPLSFSQGAPMLEVDRAALKQEEDEAHKGGTSKNPGSSSKPAVDEATPREYTAKEIRAEIRKEMLFLLPPLTLALAWALLTWRIPGLARAWGNAFNVRWVSGLLGSAQGALVGGFVVWLTRILGSVAFGREAMGMGDVDLMAGIGAVVGAGAATIAFFLAPFFGIAIAIYLLLTGTRRELPYGPYLSLATAFVMLWYCPIAEYLTPGLLGLGFLVRQLFGGSS